MAAERRAEFAELDRLIQAHTSQTGQTGAAYEIDQQRLGLVIRRVGDQYGRGGVLVGNVRQSVVPRRARGLLQRPARQRFPVGSDVYPLDLGFHTETLREGRNPLCIRGRLRPQAVVDVRRDDVQLLLRVHQCVQQTGRVLATRESHDEPGARCKEVRHTRRCTP
jgi:hypothetical protein